MNYLTLFALLTTKKLVSLGFVYFPNKPEFTPPPPFKNRAKPYPKNGVLEKKFQFLFYKPFYLLNFLIRPALRFSPFLCKIIVTGYFFVISVFFSEPLFFRRRIL
jgi:hypothetical protein